MVHRASDSRLAFHARRNPVLRYQNGVFAAPPAPAIKKTAQLQFRREFDAIPCRGQLKAPDRWPALGRFALRMRREQFHDNPSGKSN